jgi:hypothetical protein
VNLQSFLCSISDFAKQPCHCCISAWLACLESSECWLAGVFMKQLACHLHWDWHSTDSSAKLFDSFQLTTMHAISACLFGHAIFTTFSSTSF